MRSLLCLVTLFFATVCFGQKGSINNTAVRNFQNELVQLKQALKIPGLSVAIVKEQRLVFAKGYGWADREAKIPATENTLYSIASVTKTFTSVILLKLAEEGKVDLMTPISRFDTTLKNDSLKVIHFLTHTSEGMPGSQYRYNGDRFAVLTKVIETATGSTYAEAVNKLVLSTAGMKESVAGQDILEDDPRYRHLRVQLAKPYTLYGRNELILSPYPAKKITASAGLLSNVKDLAKYDIALDKGRLVNQSSLDKAWTPFSLQNGNAAPYGLGWFTQDYNGNKLVWHSGQWPTYTALYLKVPEKNLTLILLANSDGVSKPFSLGRGNVLHSAFAVAFLRNFLDPSSKAGSFKWDTDSTAFKKQLESTAKAGKSEFQNERNAYGMIQKYLAVRKQRQKEERHLSVAILATYVGTFELLPSPLKFSVHDGKFWVETSLLTAPVEVFAEAENKFFIKILDARFEFVKDVAGNVSECILYLDGGQYRCRKL